jgi:Kef-type K+ transport system membrane component KefB
MEQPLISILAFVGFVATLVIAIVIGLASREDSTGLSWWFFVVAGVTALLFVWFITRFGVQLQIW